MKSEKSFTLVELLIVIAILAILAVVVILVINPVEFLKQTRDSRRLVELQDLNKALALYQTDRPGTFMGTSSIVYVSVADSSSSCGNLGLPALPDGWSYNCVSSSTLKNVNGTGWVPVSFTSISWGSPVSVLPIDPQNTTSTGQYYTYVAGGSWELTALTESDKYLPKAINDGDSYPGVYSLRTSASTLTPGIRDKGLVGYWKFEESSGTLYDSSGYSNNGTQSGGVTYGATGKVGYALSFDGTNDYVNTATNNGIPIGSSNRSVTAWFYRNKSGDSQRFVAWGSGGNTQFSEFGLSSGNKLVFVSSNNNFQSNLTPALGEWSFVAVTISGTSVVIYLNGISEAEILGLVLNTQASNVYIGSGMNGPTNTLGGLLDDVRIYNRALSAAEIAAIYNATR